ncbi:uncharacterized protein [Diabrotica undecimpunctata]|uniref:uncharacterized protein n=1 Tax=Diabrotica undecimpunctata TaxID=50387 RepID=UPI003B6336D9
MNISLSDVGKTAPIEILFGADIVGNLYTGRKYQLQCGLLVVETLLGWTLMGKVPAVASNFSTSMITFLLFVNNSSVAKLGELDVIEITDPVEKMTREVAAKKDKNFFYETVRCDSEGRSNLFESYNFIFNEWLNEGVIEIVNNPEENNCVHYLPHRPVIKNNSETTKIRPVFDASSHKQGCPSLNQCLEVGSKLIELIPCILLRFRQQKRFLRFLWVNDAGKEFVFRHKRVVFGVNCSPFLLGATIEFHLTKALEKCCNDNPYSKNTIEKLMTGFYVDNCVTSVTDENELRLFVSEATALMEEATKDLRRWEASGNTKTVVPLLGLLWDSSKDTLKINSETFQEMELKRPITKRLMLSIAQSIFNPKLWGKRQGWEALVENDMAEEFCNWVTHLPELSSIEIPRWIQAGNMEADHWSLHMFSDATAKSRVAPLKEISTLRIELLVATIGVRFYQSVKRQFSQYVESYFWSDSTTVLSWIQRKDDWYIQTKYVPGSLNPADLPSRGCGVRQLFHSRWWEGPEWLYRKENDWPQQQKLEVHEEEVCTEKKKNASPSLLNMTSDDWHLHYFSQYIKLLRMIAWALRFCYNARNLHEKRTGELVAEEIDKAEIFVLKLVQNEGFGSDTKRISLLNPFVDEFGFYV